MRWQRLRDQGRAEFAIQVILGVQRGPFGERATQNARKLLGFLELPRPKIRFDIGGWMLMRPNLAIHELGGQAAHGSGEKPNGTGPDAVVHKQACVSRSLDDDVGSHITWRIQSSRQKICIYAKPQAQSSNLCPRISHQ